MGRACRPPLGDTNVLLPLPLPVSSNVAHLVPCFLREESRESRYVSGISNADSSYRPLYLQREYKGEGGEAREHTTPRKRAVYIYISLSLRATLARWRRAQSLYLSVPLTDEPR